MIRALIGCPEFSAATAGFAWESAESGRLATDLPGGHAYSILDYEPETDMVTLRNPWKRAEPTLNGAAKDGNDDGIFEMSMEDVSRTFLMLAFEDDS